jgi:hypothetical protein
MILAMVVIENAKDGDCGHLVPIEASVLLFRNRVMRRNEDQAVGMVEIARELALSVSLELVEICLRHIAQIVQTHCRLHLLKAEEDFLGPEQSELSLGKAMIIGASSEEVILERYVHNGRMQQKVNRLGELIL